MKLFALPFALVISALLFSSASSAQQVDLVVSDILVSSAGENVPPGITTTLAIIVTNVDSTIVEAGDTIHVSMGLGSFTVHDMIELSIPLGPGASTYLNFGVGNRYTFSTSADTIQAWGSVSYINDSIDSNDVLLDTFYTGLTAISNDWECTNVDVITPSNLDGFDIDNGTNQPPALSNVSVTFENMGSVYYLEGTQFKYAIYSEVDASVLTVDVELNLSPGNAMTRYVTNQSVLPALPDSVGNYSLCAYALAELSAQLDGCYEYELVDNYDPNDPKNWPWGIEDLSSSFYNVYQNSEQLIITDFDGSIQAALIDINGRQVVTSSGQSQVDFTTSSLSSGIYILEVNSDREETNRSRVFIP